MTVLQDTMGYTLDENEREVLNVLREEGRVNPLRIREATGLRKQYVNDALKQLKKNDVVQKVNRGLYEYVPEEDGFPGAPREEFPEEARRALDGLVAALKRGDRARAEDRFDELLSAFDR